jgi:hypothetical protein
LLSAAYVHAALPAGTRAWECVPGVVLDDGVDSFRVEVNCNGPVSSVSLSGVSTRFLWPQASPLALRDDGQGGDRIAGDFVYTGGPFRYNTAIALADHYRNDPASPAGLDAVAIGDVTIRELDGRTSRFLLGPRVGVLHASIVPTGVAVLSADVVVSRHLINVRSSTYETQRFLRGAGGDLRRLANVLYPVVPDAMDFLMFFSTHKVEQVVQTATANFTAALHATVRVNYTGTGRTPLDDTASYGSGGRLLSVNALDAYDRGIASRTATHELVHQWASYLDPSLGLGDGQGHYSPRSSAGSLCGGFVWNAGTGGQWMLDCVQGVNGAYRLPPLDQYLLGLIDASQVPPVRVYSDAGPPPLQRCGQAINDVTRTVTIQNIQAVHGVRLPGPATAQRDFAIGFVAESQDRFLTATEMTYYEILAEHYTGSVPAAQPDPYLGDNWVPVTRFFGSGTTWSSVVPRSTDFDDDGDVDLPDFYAFQACFNGPNRPPRQADCGMADVDADMDVDMSDFGRLSACFNGPNRPAVCQ